MTMEEDEDDAVEEVKKGLRESPSPSLRTTTTAATNVAAAAVAKEAERCAARVVQSVRDVVDFLRSQDQFPKHALTLVADPAASCSTSRTTDDDERLKKLLGGTATTARAKLSAIPSALVANVREASGAVDRLAKATTRSSDDDDDDDVGDGKEEEEEEEEARDCCAAVVAESCVEDETTTTTDVAADVAENDDDGGGGDDAAALRHRIVHEICFPLLESLWRCYAILDRFVADDEDRQRQRQEKQRQQSTTGNDDDRNNNTTRKKKAPKRPVPPAGMLSLQNYTDVAALLEFTACTAVLPFLDRNVLPSPEDRARHLLPKSITGRLPRRGLFLWGTAVVQRQRRSDAEEVESHRRRQQQAIFELQRGVTVIGNLLLLDRFRPMLLPRHLPDLYAAIFQCRHVQQQLLEQRDAADAGNISQQPLPQQRHLRNSFDEIQSHLLPSSQREQIARATFSSPVVDATLQARALQALLGRGMAAPRWLRDSVARNLETLATTDLTALLAVFVDSHNVPAAEASSSSSSGSSLRLARTLAAAPKRGRNVQQEPAADDAYFDAIGRQTLQLLDEIVASSSQSSPTSREEKENASPTTCMPKVLLSRQHVAYVHATWAILDILPQPVLDRHIIAGFDWKAYEEKKGEDSDTAAGLRRWILLLSYRPPFANTERLCRLALSPMKSQGTKCSSGAPRQCQLRPSLLALLLRLAEPRVLFAPVQQDAVALLRILSDAVLRIEFKPPGAGGSNKDVVPLPGFEVLAVALVYALAPYDSDFRAAYVDAQKAMSAIAHGIEERAKIVTGHLLNYLLESKQKNNNRPNDDVNNKADREESLVAAMFLELLYQYVNTGNLVSVDGPEFSETFRDGFHMVPLVALPLLCEACPMDVILHSNSTGSSFYLFRVMKLVFTCTTARLCGGSGLSSEAEAVAFDLKRTSSFDNRRATITSSVLGFESTLSGDASPSVTAKRIDNEMLLSLCSLLLSLLVGILELGSGKRSDEEERMLQDFSEALRPLAGDSLDFPSDPIPEELKEVASHAIVLLIARLPPQRDSGYVAADNRATEAETVPDVLDQLEEDLQCTDVPVRARAVVTLRHLASARGEHDFDPSDGSILSAKTETDDSFWRMLRLSIQALSDSESYVYLAAIQTVVAFADVSPEDAIVRLGLAVSIGELQCDDGRNIALSPEQRVKLAEALVGIIRRKATTVEYVPSLLYVLVYGSNESGSNSRSVEDGEIIQRETHKYFIHGRNGNDEVGQPSSQEERWEETDIRVATGGPLFKSEEKDVVRAAKINVVSELVAAVNPAVLARHCSDLVACSKQSLQLDVSRPVRRAGALLSRSLYAALVREKDGLVASASSSGAHVSYASAMVSAQEDTLAAALERCVKVDDLGDLGEEKRRQYDPASIARCREALALRREAEEGGILALAGLARESERREHRDNPIIRTLLEPSLKNDPSAPTFETAKKRIIEEL